MVGAKAGRYTDFSYVLQYRIVMGFPAMWKTWVRPLSWEDALEKELATHSSILAGKSHRQRNLMG